MKFGIWKCTLRLVEW